MDKSFAVFGLGKFGRSVATELANAGADVLAVDINKERVHALADIATCAVAADIRDTEAMESLGISNMDAVVVAITRSLDASILATIFAKESGVPYVIAKSQDETHSKILKKAAGSCQQQNRLLFYKYRVRGIAATPFSLSENPVLKACPAHPARIFHSFSAV